MRDPARLVPSINHRLATLTRNRGLKGHDHFIAFILYSRAKAGRKYLKVFGL